MEKNLRHLFFTAVLSLLNMSCKTCEEAWSEYEKAIDKKAKFGACTVNFDCIRVKEIPELVYSKLPITLFDQQHIEELRLQARQVCMDQSHNEARAKNKTVKLNPILKKYAGKLQNQEACCLAGQCALANVGTCANKIPYHEVKALEQNDAVLTKAIGLYNKRQYAQVYDLLISLKWQGPQKLDQHFLLGMAQFSLGKFKESVQWLEEPSRGGSNQLMATYYGLCSSAYLKENERLLQVRLNRVLELVQSDKKLANDYRQKLERDACFRRIKDQSYFKNSVARLQKVGNAKKS